MSALIVFTVLSVICLVPLVAKPAHKLPTIQPCPQSDPELNKCVLQQVTKGKPYIAKGVPELNIPSVEPLHIPMVTLEQGTQAVNYKAKLKDLKVYGLSHYKFQKIDLNLDTLMVSGMLSIPVLHLESDYTIRGRALLVPIQGNGIFKANLTDAKVKVKMQGKLVDRKGQEYLEVKDTMVKLDIGGATAHFGNLFNGDKTLGAATNSFLNENAKDIIDEVKPAVESVVNMLIDDIVNKVFKSLPFLKVFPKN
nr:PREDICTED: protein takeout-like [Bemisia tabaci]